MKGYATGLASLINCLTVLAIKVNIGNLCRFHRLHREDLIFTLDIVET